MLFWQPPALILRVLTQNHGLIKRDNPKLNIISPRLRDRIKPSAGGETSPLHGQRSEKETFHSCRKEIKTT